MQKGSTDTFEDDDDDNDEANNVLMDTFEDDAIVAKALDATKKANGEEVKAENVNAIAEPEMADELLHAPGDDDDNDEAHNAERA